MTEPWQRPLIDACKRSIAAMLNELDEADDLDAWEEADSKLTDVLIVYRRSQSIMPPEQPARVQFTPGQLAEMAFCAAVSDFAAEIEEEGE